MPIKELLKDKRLFETEIIVILLTFLFYIFRPSVPFFKYPFLLLYLCLIIFTFIKYKGRLIISLKEFISDYYLILGLTIIYILSLIFSDKLYLTIFKDAFNGLIILSLFFLSSCYVTGRKQLNQVVDLLFLLIIIFSFVISVIGFCILLDIFPGGEVYPLIGNFSESIPVIAMDNNFGILPVILGILAVFYFLIKTNSKFYVALSNFLLIVFSVRLFFAGSRRGLFILVLIICFLVFLQAVRILNLKQTFGKLALKTWYLLVSLFVIVLISLCVIFYTSNSFKNKTLTAIGSKNILNSKVKITSVLLKYTLIFNKSLSYLDLYNRLWTPEFNSYDPESSWGMVNHKTIFPLTGKNVEIVPKGSKGYMLDSTCNSYFESTYSDSFSLLTQLTVKKGDKYRASINCFVSEDFDGDVVRLSVATDCINNNIVSGNPVAVYDLLNKGIWKKLEINFDCNQGTVPIYISIVKNGVKDFSKLKGYLIFAYPIIEKITVDTLNFSIACKPLTPLNFITGEISDQRIVGAGFLGMRSSFSDMVLQNVNNQNDLIRNLANRLISEDTVYHPYKSKLQIDKTWNKYGDERLMRWMFALKIYSTEFNFRQKLIGGGFNFLNWYGYYFLHDKTASDWPHNPFLSVLLYSGIIGLLVYCFFIYKVFYYYLKYRREAPLLFIFFLITFFFAFFSGGSPFDPPIMGFFAILPFFIHSIHKKEDQNNILLSDHESRIK
jgi:hypothetical protein